PHDHLAVASVGGPATLRPGSLPRILAVISVVVLCRARRLGSQVRSGDEPFTADALPVGVARIPILRVGVEGVAVVENLLAVCSVQDGQPTGQRRATAGRAGRRKERRPGRGATAAAGDGRRRVWGE